MSRVGGAVVLGSFSTNTYVSAKPALDSREAKPIRGPITLYGRVGGASVATRPLRHLDGIQVKRERFEIRAPARRFFGKPHASLINAISARGDKFAMEF